MSISVVTKHDFGKGFQRLDAEFVEASVLYEEQVIRREFVGSKLQSQVENELSGRVQSGELKRKLEADGCVRYIAIDSVDTADGLSFETEYFDLEDLPSRATYDLEARDIIVSNVRPNRGAMALVRADQVGAIASSGFTLLRLAKDPAGPTPEYLFALLKSRVYRDQLIRRSRGSMFPAVVRSDIVDLYIPRLSKAAENKVFKLVSRAVELHSEFFELKKKSRELLENFLAPIGSPPSPMTTRKQGVDSTISSAKAFFSPEGAQRIDAEFFRGEYAEFDKRCIAQGETFNLGDWFDLNPGRALSASSKSTPYAKQGILTNVGINWSALEETDGSIPSGGWRVQNDDILLACTAHEIAYIGRKVDLVTEVPEWAEGNVGCVPDLMIIRKKKDSPPLSLHYLAAFLRHPAGLHQVQRCIRGLRGGHVYRKDLSKYVRVPVPSKHWMTNFDEIESAAERTRNLAKSIMADAVTIIDEIIQAKL